ncbi:MAG TPA: methyltransferase domain-containing protein [Bryobacteraceae bacterium]|nr:methyltransferase domain-containing protein [Bryobacteraceae bacterium]
MKDLPMTAKNRKAYIPAANHDFFLPCYDVITKLMGADRSWTDLVNQAAPRPGERVLEIGCGTGSLTVRAKRLYPQIDIIGLDPDPKALARARRKAQRSAVSIQFTEGLSECLPYSEHSFDHVFSSFMFHHLENDTKEKTLREIRRVLKPGGYLHLLDFGGPEPGRANSFSRWLHSHHRLEENSEARILMLMEEAGLSDGKVVGRRSLLFGLTDAVRYRASAQAMA